MISKLTNFAYLVPATTVIPLGMVYMFGDAASSFGWAIFGVLLLVMVQETVSRGLSAHLGTMTAIMERTEVTAKSVDTQHRADTDRLNRFEAKLDRIQKDIENFDGRCELKHTR